MRPTFFLYPVALTKIHASAFLTLAVEQLRAWRYPTAGELVVVHASDGVPLPAKPRSVRLGQSETETRPVDDEASGDVSRASRISVDTWKPNRVAEPFECDEEFSRGD